MGWYYLILYHTVSYGIVRYRMVWKDDMSRLIFPSEVASSDALIKLRTIQ